MYWYIFLSLVCLCHAHRDALVLAIRPEPALCLFSCILHCQCLTNAHFPWAASAVAGKDSRTTSLTCRKDLCRYSHSLLFPYIRFCWLRSLALVLNCVENKLLRCFPLITEEFKPCDSDLESVLNISGFSGCAVQLSLFRTNRFRFGNSSGHTVCKPHEAKPIALTASLFSFSRFAQCSTYLYPLKACNTGNKFSVFSYFFFKLLTLWSSG